MSGITIRVRPMPLFLLAAGLRSRWLLAKCRVDIFRDGRFVESWNAASVQARTEDRVPLMDGAERSDLPR